MYIPRHFATDERQALKELLALSPLVQLISVAEGSLIASALPMLLIEDEDRLVLQGHFARPNDHWKHFDSSIDTLAIVTGPDAYISPSSYPSKAETHQVVPTWNYESVHASGPLTIHDDPDWVLDLVTHLTNVHEESKPTPWKVSDAPRDYIATRLRGIVGVEMVVTSLVAKAKLSQDKSDPDRLGAQRGLATGSATDRLVAQRMAGLPEE